MDYSKTLRLPQTEFPMRGNLPQKEPQFVELWKDKDLYNKRIEKRKKAGAPRFDGSPDLLTARRRTANTVPHHPRKAYPSRSRGRLTGPVMGKHKGVVVPDEAPGERRLEDVVAERVLDDFALEVDGEDD